MVYQNGIHVPFGTTWYTNGIVTTPGSEFVPMSLPGGRVQYRLMIRISLVQESSLS